MSFAYERRHQPLAPMVVFRRRVVHHAGLALAALVASVLLGVIGYHALGGEAWLDSLLDACMLLGGMGQVGAITTTGGKLFASFYALYAGLFFIAVSGLLLAPFLHRIVHRFHLDK